MTTIVILVIIVLLAVFVAGIYNRLVGLRNRYRNAFAQIDVQLKRRYDLIPNLVETARAYMGHERQTLESVTAARNHAAQAGAAAAARPGDPSVMAELQRAETQLGGALSRLLVTVESYPNLKANETMTRLMEELTSTENKVAFARQAYNDGVTIYNTARETFPAVLVAGSFGFGPAALFEVAHAEEREAPKVSFS